MEPIPDFNEAKNLRIDKSWTLKKICNYSAKEHSNKNDS